MKLAYESYLDTITEEATRLSDALHDVLERPVPACPGWLGADLGAHLEKVCRSWEAQLENADVEERVASPPIGANGSVLDRFEDAVGDLVASLSERGQDAPCWNQTGDDLNAWFVARRVALEMAVHRVDAELIVGRATPIEAELASEGIEERIEVFLRRKLRAEHGASLGGTLCLICEDQDAAFVVEVDHGRLRWRRGRGPADAVVVAGASDLLLFTWNRQGIEGFKVTGDPAIALAWSGLPG